MTPGRRKAVAGVCIALVVFVGFIPALASAVGSAVLVPLWLVIPAIIVILIRRAAFRCDEQPLPLLALLDSRGPPALSPLE